jgi:hypothetical protein
MANAVPIKIKSIFVDDCPVGKATFLPNGSQVIIAGRGKYHVAAHPQNGLQKDLTSYSLL